MPNCKLPAAISNQKECVSDNMQKEPEERKETFSQLKRRRMLQFDTQAVDSPFCNEEMLSVFLSNVNDRYPFNFLTFHHLKLVSLRPG